MKNKLFPLILVMLITACSSASALTPETLTNEMKEKGHRIKSISNPAPIELNGELPSTYQVIKDIYCFYQFENNDEVEKAKGEFEDLMSTGDMALKMNFYTVDNIVILHQYVNDNGAEKGAEIIEMLQKNHTE
ncbi:hypothetical protein ACOJQI_09975 [Bacillus salacetis]|uniref:hypothetical protein n=1 Tax=Bacillus salacetis TaxID=2315464 RepID=UPI003BA2D329